MGRWPKILQHSRRSEFIKALGLHLENAGDDHIKNKCQWPYADAFHVQQRENRKVIDTVASFDRTTKTWSVHRDEREKVKRYQFDQPNNTLDVITAVYLARSLDFK